MRIGEIEELVEAGLQGLGLVQVPDYLVDRSIGRGELVELLPSCRPPTIPIHLVRPAGRVLPTRVRAAMDALDALRERKRVAAPPSAARGHRQAPSQSPTKGL